VVVAGGLGSCFSFIASCCFVLDRAMCHGVSVLGCFGPPSLASLIIKALEIILLSIHLGLKGLNMKLKAKQVNTNRNRE